jgi:hypothetical protein
MKRAWFWETLFPQMLMQKALHVIIPARQNPS